VHRYAVILPLQPALGIVALILLGRHAGDGAVF